MSASAKSTGDETKSQRNEDNPEKTKADEEDYGYYFYPQREEKKKLNFVQRALYHEDINHFKCRLNVKSCMESNPMVKLMVGALASQGCPVDPERHVSCETCLKSVSGGFDPKAAQVVLCQNTIQNRDVCCNVLSHELLHAFDFCRAKVDFETDLHHLACTEIRAANMNHCSLAAAFATGEVSLFGVKERHQLCVKNKALQSIMLVRDISKMEGMAVVDEVFERCYNDTEPYGRRCFKNDRRAKRAFDDSRNYYDYE